jgi:hypothetical protein
VLFEAGVARKWKLPGQLIVERHSASPKKFPPSLRVEASEERSTETDHSTENCVARSQDIFLFSLSFQVLKM